MTDAGSDQSVFVGDRVVVDGRRSTAFGSGPLSFQWSFTLPRGSAATLSGANTFLLDAPGRYEIQLVVNDGLDDSEPAALEVAATPAPDYSIGCGETVAGSILDPLHKDRYIFEAAAGEAAMFAVVATSASIRPRADLLGPDGRPVVGGLAINGASLPAVFPVSGTYTIVVGDDDGRDTGGYNLNLQFTTGRCAQPIACGQTLSGAVPRGANATGHPQAQQDSHRFTATAGEAVVFAVVRSSGLMRPRADLYGPNGRAVLGGLAVDGASLSATLTTTGTYTLVVRDDDAKDGGTYNLNLQFTTGRCGEAIACGETRGGAMPDGTGNPTGNAQAQQDSRTFIAAAGEAVVFAAVATSGALRPRTDLYGPAGRLVLGGLAVNGASLVAMLPDTGTYTLIVRDDDLRDGGTYSLDLQFTTGRCGRSLACGGTATGTIPGDDNAAGLPQAEQDSYTLTGAAGERVTYTVLRTSGLIRPRGDLYDPSGRPVLGGLAVDGSSLPILLGSDGTYTIVVRDDDLRDGGTYTIRYERVGGCPVIPQATVSPVSLDFGVQEVGSTSAPRIVTVTSSGTGTLSIANVTTRTPNFSKVADLDHCSSTELAPGASCTFGIVFAPATNVGLTDTAQIESNAPDSPHIVELSGTGVTVQPPCPVTATPNPAPWFAESVDPIHGTGGSRGMFTFVGAIQGLPAGGIVLAGDVSPTDTSLVFQVSLHPASRPLVWVGTRFLSPLTDVAGTTGAGWIPGSEPDTLTDFAAGIAGGGVDTAWLIMDGVLDAGRTTNLFFVSLPTELVRPGLTIHYNVVESAAGAALLGIASAVVGCGNEACIPLPAGVVGWWTGNGFADDVISPSQNGVLMNGATFALGRDGQAFSLDGVDDFVQIPDSPALRPASITVDAWVNFRDLEGTVSGNAPPGLQYVLFKRNSRPETDSEGYTLAKIRTAEGDRLSFGISSAEGEKATLLSTTLVEPGRFYHVAGTFDGVEGKLYVNGVLEHAVAHPHPLDVSTEPLTIGRANQPQWDGACSCLVDEVEVFDRALEADEIVALYAAGSAGKCRDRVVTVSPGHLSFDPQPVGTPSDARIIVVSNVGTGPITITSVVSTPEFPVVNDLCVAALLGPGQTCSFGVQFVPGQFGLRTGAVAVSSDAIGSPHEVAFAGSGETGGVTADPPQLAFGDQVHGTASEPWAVILRNGRAMPVELGAFVVTTDFGIRRRHVLVSRPARRRHVRGLCCLHPAPDLHDRTS
jgi:hypothetical protein